MKKILSIAVIFIIVLSVFSVFTIHSARSETGNKYRRPIIVDNSNNSETLINYQVFINVTYDSNMQPDFDDLRFIWYNETSGQEVNINYWLDKYVDSEYALVWVEVPSIRSLGQEILYVYYGDPDAVSGSNGEETFVFFDGFSTDTTSNYEIWHGKEENEFSWNSNGWLFVNASILERDFPYPKCSNVGVRHKTALIDATEEKYYLETRAKAFGTGFNDGFGVKCDYKYASTPNWEYHLSCAVRVMTNIQSKWGSGGPMDGWEFRHFGSIELDQTGKDRWYRFGVGTSPNGTIYGRFYDDDYNEIETLVNQTVHHDNEWWISLTGSRYHNWTETPATLCVYFDYVRVRKFADPEPSYSIGEEPWPAWEYIFEDSCRGTTLKISTDDKYFQFIALDKTFSIKHDPNMTVGDHYIAIDFEDTKIKLHAIAIMTRRWSLCIATATDVETGTRYWLIEVNWHGRFSLI